MKMVVNPIKNVVRKPARNASYRRGYVNAEFYLKKYDQAMKVLSR
jgi:hypothetical protein